MEIQKHMEHPDSIFNLESSGIMLFPSHLTHNQITFHRIIYSSALLDYTTQISLILLKAYRILISLVIINIHLLVFKDLNMNYPFRFLYNF